MGFQIESGDHNAYMAKVSKDGRVQTDAVASSAFAATATVGQSFSLTTDFIPLTTTASFSGIFYVKNNSTVNFKIHFIRASSAVQTQFRGWRNPTTGTLITTGAAGTPSNSNFGSGGVFGGDFKIGADGLTITDGILNGQAIITNTSLFEVGGGIIIPNGGSFAIEAKPSASTDVAITVFGYCDTGV